MTAIDRLPRYSRVATLAMVCVALTACAVGPEYEEPASRLPDAWATSATSALDTSAVEEQWWNRFGDPLLTEFVLLSRQQNFDLQAAAIRVAQRAVQRNQVAGGRAPSVTGKASSS